LFFPVVIGVPVLYLGGQHPVVLAASSAQSVDPDKLAADVPSKGEYR
jgi:hypothetical protein